MNYILNRILKFLHRIFESLGVNEETRYALIRYLFNTGWIFAEKILVLSASFFVGIYVVRYLGPIKYGLLSYSISFVFLFQSFSKLGLDGIVVRNLIQFPEKKKQIIGSSTVLKSIGSIIAIVLTLLSIFVIETNTQTKVLILIISFSMIFSGFETAQFWFESQVKAKYNAISNSAASITASIIKIILIVKEADLLWFAVVFSIEVIIRNFGYFTFYQYQFKDFFSIQFDKITAKQLLKDSFPLFLSGVAVMLYLRIDQVMINEMLGNRETGIYSAAVNLSEIWYFIPVIISNSVFPAIIDAKGKSKELYEKRIQQLYNLMSLIAVFLVIPILFFGHEIIDIIYGQSYSEAGSVLQIHILSLIFVFWGTTSGKWLITENFVKISLYRTLAGAIVNIIANIFLIKYYGISGAAVATILAYMISGFLFDIFYKKTHISFGMKCKSLNLLRTFRIR